MESVNFTKQRKTVLKGALSKFTSYVGKLVDDAINKDELKATDNVVEQDTLYDESDDYHLAYLAARNGALKKLGFSVTEPYIQTPSRHPTISETNTNAPNQANKSVHLQPIPLPSFNGTVTQWPEFADLFKSLVINNKNLSNVERLLHLKSCITGEAAKALASINTLDSNFDVAWKTLEKQYENPKLIIETHVKSLFALPKVNDNPNSIRDHLNQFRTNCEVLKTNESLTIDNILIQFSILKFDEETREKWEEYSYDIQSPTYEKIIEFLNQRAQIRTAAAKNAVKKSKDVESTKRSYPYSTSQFSHFTVNSKLEKPRNTPNSCEFCGESHRIYNCSRFAKLTANQRYDVVKERKWCLNCLGTGHGVKQCKSVRNCFKCSKRHNTLLHNESTATQHPIQHTPHAQEPQTQTAAHVAAIPSTSALPSSERAFTSSVVGQQQPTQILLSTVLFDIRSAAGTKVRCRALLDNGSQPHIVTQKLVDLLGIRYTQCIAQLAGVGTAATLTKGYVTLKICSIYNAYDTTISATVVDNITHNIPTYSIDTSQFSFPSDVVLADPQFDIPGAIDVIIGADLFYRLLCPGRYTIPNGPTLQETQLGWVVSGRVPVLYPAQNDVAFHVRIIDPLEAQLRKFWEIEGVSNFKHDESENHCEIHFQETVSRDEYGRFVVKLPFTPLKEELGSNYEDAKRRLVAIENRLGRNSSLKVLYTQFMKDYEELGHMTKCEATTTGYFIPHHAVLRDHSLSTKCRCVFDASAKSSTGLSLNDILHVGPVVQDDLFTILLRFRTHPVVFTADIERMYRQFLVHEKDTEYQKILWRSSPNESISVYRLQTVTYGTACAPFLATRCLKELALQEQSTYPGAANIILNDFYVDDCITGCANVADAMKLKCDLINVLNSAGLPLKKWRSNVSELMNDSEISTLNLNKSTMNTLGLSWDHLRDEFMYLPSSATALSKVTKRSILSDVAKLFDPLGIVAPVILKAKLLFQKLWKLNFNWDQPLAEDICKEWSNYSAELAELATLQIQWHFNPPHSPHFGGLWEAAVKAAKYHLRRIAGAATLTVEEFSTILAQTEAVLNSRPLTPTSNDINDLGALTPGHFLIGQPLTALPDVNLIEVPINRLSRWQRVQQVNQHFWQRWHREYLTQLQQRTKWKRSFKPLSVGEMVIVRDDNALPLRWKLGRVIAVSVGADQVPRVATVRTSTGIETIATNRLCLLPIDFSS